MKEGRMTRTLTLDECPWLEEVIESFRKGNPVFKNTAPSYGCTSPDGEPVCLQRGGEFYEVPKDSVRWIKVPVNDEEMDNVL